MPSTLTGLTSNEAKKRLKEFGPNILVTRERQSALVTFLGQFKSPLIIMLLTASAISFFSGSYVSSILIATIILASAIISFVVSYKSQKSAEKLAQQIQTQATVRRDGVDIPVETACLVLGDIVVVEAGNIIPADGKVVEGSDFFVNESSLTGESFPIEKDVHGEVYLGSGVVTGQALIEVTATGVHTKFYSIMALLSKKEVPNEFEVGITKFSYMTAQVILAMTVFVFLMNAIFKHDILQSLTFSLALTVGFTPELLPMIIALNVSKASIVMAKKGVIVKKLSAIQSFGSMDILCTDKTGTLTEDKISLVHCVDADNKESAEVFKLAYMTSNFHTGTKSPLDTAIAEYHHVHHDASYTKIDEIPFDFERRRSSVVVASKKVYTLITKGAIEEVLAVSEITVAEKNKVMKLFTELSEGGYRVLAVATKKLAEKKERYGTEIEKALTFQGLVTFIDPPKKDVKKVLDELHRRGITIKIVTGDHGTITQKVATDVGFTDIVTLEGKAIEELSDEALAIAVEKTTIFARVSPIQKNRIIETLRTNGHVVGYMGDGINDAPSLRAADVGISVHNAVDVAKEAADIILVHKSLRQLIDGVLEGRRTFANTIKYITLAISSNFGNMFSMTGASLLLPFFPMLPAQLLLNNMLYESSQFALSFDYVDDEVLNKPKPWDLPFIKKFMVIFGSISSLFDFLMFFVLYKVFTLGSSGFQTGWFIESLATQMLVIFIIRTPKSIFKTKFAHPLVTISSLVVVVIGWSIALSKLGTLFNFTPLPLPVLITITVIIFSYLFTIELYKKRFYRLYNAQTTLVSA